MVGARLELPGCPLMGQRQAQRMKQRRTRGDGGGGGGGGYGAHREGLVTRVGLTVPETVTLQAELVAVRLVVCMLDVDENDSVRGVLLQRLHGRGRLVMHLSLFVPLTWCVNSGGATSACNPVVCSARVLVQE